MMALQWYQWMALAALGICLTACLVHFIRLLRLGKPVDYSRPAGKTGKAVRYAFTGAMSPARKESAFLHLPTYTAGLFYHMGTFLSLLLFFFFISGLVPEGWIANVIMAFLCISALSGTAILFKRVIRKELRALSNPDDFISNFLVTIFQFTTIAVLLVLTVLPSYHLPIVLPSYYLIFTILMLYIPIGKLRHTVYFFAARYHLGIFFGWRGVWPPGNVKN
ncbi:MAG: hypothetical protein M0Q51_03735 [Bacteroidales bacterium]|nr:hypothetical protein [Bacteroidales bacterium]